MPSDLTQDNFNNTQSQIQFIQNHSPVGTLLSPAHSMCIHLSQLSHAIMFWYMSGLKFALAADFNVDTFECFFDSASFIWSRSNFHWKWRQEFVLHTCWKMPSHFLWYERHLGQIITTYSMVTIRDGHHATLLHLSAIVLPQQQQEAFRPPQHSDTPGRSAWWDK